MIDQWPIIITDNKIISGLLGLHHNLQVLIFVYVTIDVYGVYGYTAIQIKSLITVLEVTRSSGYVMSLLVSFSLCSHFVYAIIFLWTVQ